MNDHFVLAAQLSTSHSSGAALEYTGVQAKIKKITDIIPLDILIVGARETPGLFKVLSAPDTRLSKEVFLWFNVLSDYRGLEPAEAVVNYKGSQGGGWSGWVDADEDMTETFEFGCVNRPEVRQKVSEHLSDLLNAYPDFDGVFIDKYRFLSPAMGKDQMLACFCPHCYERAKAKGLDLDEVKAVLLDANHPAKANTADIPQGAPWLNALLQNEDLLGRFLRFRADCITELVRQLSEIIRAKNKKMALDLFAPGLAPVVGQDYSQLGKYAEWGKPMAYRIAKVPASLRLEIPSMVNAVSEYSGASPESAFKWLQGVMPEFENTSLDDIAAKGVPLSVVARELRAAVELLAPARAYMGLETVSYQDIIDIQPHQVAEVIAVGREAGVAGAILSWDLMYTPLENIQALKDSL